MSFQKLRSDQLESGGGGGIDIQFKNTELEAKTASQSNQNSIFIFPPPFSVTFDIRDTSNAPVAGADIVFNGSPVAGYIVENVAPGTYTYSVSKSGYITATGSAVVDDQSVIEVVQLVDDVSAPNTYTIEIPGTVLTNYSQNSVPTLPFADLTTYSSTVAWYFEFSSTGHGNCSSSGVGLTSSGSGAWSIYRNPPAVPAWLQFEFNSSSFGMGGDGSFGTVTNLKIIFTFP